MNKQEINKNLLKLWKAVQVDRVFSEEIMNEVNRVLHSKNIESDEFKKLGTELYLEVGRSNYPDGDVRRDGIRSMSHFLMSVWDMKSGRIEESKKRMYIAEANMNNYFKKRLNA